MPTLRLLAWNCHHGSLLSRLDDVGPLTPDITFLQEVLPCEVESAPPGAVVRRVNSRKAVALIATNPVWSLAPLTLKRTSGKAVVAATVTGPMSFNLIGVWAQGPPYAADVLKTVTACKDIIRSAPTVIMGDFNSGSKLFTTPRPTHRHAPVVAALEKLGLVSAYHAFHNVDVANEAHATYRHLFKAEQPWHIDLCFVPKAWTAHIESVDVVDSDHWRRASDHAPLRVDLQL